jgi:branched-chain amino acid aminotransferase
MSHGVGGATFGDVRNGDSLLVYMNVRGPGSGAFVPRAQALVSVFDSGFLMGDAVWEGMRLYNGKWFCLDKHLRRLYEAAKFMDMDIGLDPHELRADLARLATLNGMMSGCHCRLMVTSGEKWTPYQGRSVNKGPATVVCIAEFKPAATADSPAQVRGLRLHTVHVRRGYPDSQEQKLNSHSKINCVTACIAAGKAGADEALMLDPHGMVATCNSTHFFIVRNGQVWTSFGSYCIPGITRANVLELCRAHGIPCCERDFSLYEVYAAEEAFVTGSFGGITPVREVDGREIGTGLYDSWGKGEFQVGPMVRRLQQLYNEMIVAECGAL